MIWVVKTQGSELVDINAWRAGIVERAEDYEWCSFAAAVRGDEKARRGYAFMYGNGDWEMNCQT